MVLYLHIGTEKTGSSYLQTLAANNREQLEKAKIYFPKAGRFEKKIRRGEISAGNGQELSQSIQQNNKNEIYCILKEFYLTAQNLDCNKIFISNELLVKAFSDQNNWKTFFEVYEEIGFNGIKMLLFLRNPAHQALSLYKHRAKGGTTPPLEQWLQEGYELPYHLEGFICNTKKKGISCDLLYYQKKPDYMDRTLFVDWLGIDLPKTSVKKSVNPSLSLSELDFLKHVQKYNPELRIELYNRLLNLPKSKKADESEKEGMYLNYINSQLFKFNKIWGQCNDLMRNGEKLIIPDVAPSSINGGELEFVFSDAQMKIIAGLLAETLHANLRRKLRYRAIRKALGRLRNQILFKKYNQ